MTNPTEAPMANAIDDVKEWVLVPKVPTEAMYNAGYDATRKPDGFPQFADAGFVLGHSGTIYSAMLAAAPPSPAPSQHTGWSDEAVEAMAKHLCESLCRVDWNSIPDASSEDRGFPAWKVYGYYNAGKEDLRRMVRAALAASSIAPATGFEMKDLQWLQGAKKDATQWFAYWTFDREDFNSDRPTMRYEVKRFVGSGWALSVNGRPFVMYSTEAEAKAAAQADFSARIRSSISPSVAKESGDRQMMLSTAQKLIDSYRISDMGTDVEFWEDFIQTFAGSAS